MRERSRNRERGPVAPSARPTSGRHVGLDAVNAGGSSDAKTSPRLALRISRCWAQIAPTLRLSLQDGSTLASTQVEFSELLTGLLRGGVDMRRIRRMPLANVMRLGRQERDQWVESVLKEQYESRKR